MKKTMAMLLALLLVAVMLPVMAMADEATLQSKINAGETTITLTENVRESITIPEDKTVTLNLGGFTLTGYGDHTITNKGTLTVVGTGKV